ncbi:MAG: HEAT repeat domain-containing protein, partial [Planctomycetaceae bacterium]|nr:HEAT repeat domain-containing protein [Planctomycetaceae bacterium]
RMSPAEVVMPVFQTGIQPDRDPEIRKHSLLGLAMHLGVLRENGHVDVPSELFSDLLNISREQVAISRHQTAYIFGLIGSPEAVDRLEVMVEDPDQMVRVNAAIGFARNESTQGLPVFHELFEEAASWELNPSKVESDKEESLYFERMLMVVNSIKAVTKLSSSLSPEEKARFIEELQALSDSTRDSVLRTDALAAIQELT